MEAFIDPVLERLLATSVQTAALTALVWSICRAMPRLSPASHCWLWWLVALQAVLGMIVSPVQLPWLPQPTATSPMPDILPMPWHETTTLVSNAIATTVHRHSLPSWQTVALLLWISGVLVMAGFTIRSWRRAAFALKSSSPCRDQVLLDELVQTATSQRLRQIPRLHVSPDIDSPLMIGYFRPVLLLPAGHSFSREEMHMVFAHELAHLQRGDFWWDWVPSLARHLFFFHPLAHVAAIEYGIAREAACDAAAVSGGQLSRKDYGRLLVHLGTSPALPGRASVASPTFRALSRRLTTLQKTSFLPGAISAILVVAVAVVGVMPMRFVQAAAAPAAVKASPGETAVLAPSLAESAVDPAPSKPEASARTQRRTSPPAIASPALTNAMAANAEPQQREAVEYTIGPGDMLRIDVWRNPELGSESLVLPDGRISTPLVEAIAAAGKTSTQLARDIEAVLAKFVRQPKVTVIVRSVKRSATSEALMFLETQVAEYETQLRSQETRMAEFRTRTAGRTSTSDAERLSRLAHERGALQQAETSISELGRVRQELRQQLEALQLQLQAQKTRSPGAAESTSRGASLDSTVRREAAEKKLRELQAVYTDKFPGMTSQKQLVADLQHVEAQELAGDYGGAIAGLSTKLNLLTRQLAEHQVAAAQHQTEISKLDQAVRQGGDAEATYAQLVSDYEVMRNRYAELKKRRDRVLRDEAAEAVSETPDAASSTR